MNCSVPALVWKGTTCGCGTTHKITTITSSWARLTAHPSFESRIRSTRKCWEPSERSEQKQSFISTWFICMLTLFQHRTICLERHESHRQLRVHRVRGSRARSTSVRPHAAARDGSRPEQGVLSQCAFEQLRSSSQHRREPCLEARVRGRFVRGGRIRQLRRRQALTLVINMSLSHY